MKIKTKIHTFASDTDNGTNCEVFATEAELNKHLRRIMEDDAEENQTLSGLLSENKIDEAWDYWTEKCAKYLDTFNTDSREIEVEADIHVVVEVKGGVAEVTEGGDLVDVKIIDHDIKEDESERCNRCYCKVYPASPYYSTPCGTFCDTCMRLAHAETCEICRNEFNLGKETE